MNYTKTILFLLSFIISLVFFSCENSTTPPTPTKSVRDYTWTIDTLNIPDAFQNLMSSMYAANDSDIYLVGHNSGSQIYSGDGGMWHYDGKDWSVVRLKEEVGQHGTPKSVHGSSSNNVWVVGGSFEHSSILQFNGVMWKKHLGKSPNGIFDESLSKSEVYSVYAESETEVWACGDGGLIYHYDGASWDVDTIKIKLGENERFVAKDIVPNNSELYVLGFKNIYGNAYGTFYIFKKIGEKWEIEDSLSQSPQGGTIWKWGTNKFYRSKSNRLYSYGFGGVFEYSGNSWSNIFEYESPITGIDIRNEDDILAVGDFSLVSHYNGSDWEKTTDLEFSDVVYTCVWLDSNEAIIVGQLLGAYPMKTIVLHGK